MSFAPAHWVWWVLLLSSQGGANSPSLPMCSDDQSGPPLATSDHPSPRNISTLEARLLQVIRELSERSFFIPQLAEALDFPSPKRRSGELKSMGSHGVLVFNPQLKNQELLGSFVLRMNEDERLPLSMFEALGEAATIPRTKQSWKTYRVVGDRAAVKVRVFERVEDPSVLAHVQVIVLGLE